MYENIIDAVCGNMVYFRQDKLEQHLTIKKGPPDFAAQAVYQGLIYGFFTIQSTSFTINIYFPIRTMVKWLSFFMSFFRRSELKNGTAKYGGY